ncbi:uncharacterized protein HRG_10832 [Hirsutella rhossiliensis]|uniref:Uncharacterized protein n=1 Tax=Hirsutella rhossiliensis TaxID=111463 RepID=A0A9P8MRZ2_9HYPO|nr:uncharacterized protein HRG_10832 [Hirsutella rhossiliensis]KAH0958137.1 hypothetical protein HRG_10832 [Hirsutella rhossiliensis]
MPRAASPSAASRHRLLLPPLLAGLDFCRLAAPTSSAASRPDFFSPFLARLALPRLLPPLLAGLAFCRLAALPPSAVSRLRTLPPCGPFCRPAATTSSGLVGRGALRSYKSLELKASPGVPGAAHQSTTPPPPACYEEQARGLRRLS